MPDRTERASAVLTNGPAFGSADPPPLADPNDAQLPRGRGPGGPGGFVDA